MLTIAESFKRFRRQFKLSKTDVARTLNIKLPSYAYETVEKNGKARYPGGEILIKLAKAYNVSTDYLLGLSDNPKPNNSAFEVQEATTESESEEDRFKEIEKRLARLEAKMAS